MDSAWQATVHGVTKSQTRLSDFHFENTVRACQDVAVKGPPPPPDTRIGLYSRSENEGA